jgi:hypothetical protein
VTRHYLVALGVLLSCLTASPASAQTPAPQPTAKPAAPPPPPIRRWVDVQQLSFGGRFRWFENSAGKLISSTLQWQPQVRARFLFDKGAKYSINGFASSGPSFVSSWNNTGGGIGTFQGVFNLKQLFAQAEPVKGLEFQVGGLHMNRGELAEHVTYDTDAFIEGERATFRPAKGWLKQVAVTTGYFGDYREPNVFKRLDRLDEWNYGQALVGIGLGPRTTASVDYTYEAGRDIWREGINFRMPASVKLLTLVKFEAYQRKATVDGNGFNASADVRWKQLVVTGGVMSVDRFYGSVNGPLNGDRYETGTRYYSIWTYTIIPELTIQAFNTRAFATEFPVNIGKRWDVVMTFNPTATLKRAGIF